MALGFVFAYGYSVSSTRACAGTAQRAGDPWSLAAENNYIFCSCIRSRGENNNSVLPMQGTRSWASKHVFGGRDICSVAYADGRMGSRFFFLPVSDRTRERRGGEGVSGSVFRSRPYPRLRRGASAGAAHFLRSAYPCSPDTRCQLSRADLEARSTLVLSPLWHGNVSSSVEVHCYACPSGGRCPRRC